MARRRNAVAHRFARMRGLPPEEKALMQRIGHLMDAALNNRQASNPFEGSQNRTNRLVYPPTNLLVRSGMASVKIIWDATDSDELLRYEVDFTNLTTGVSETKTSFTSEIVYKGTAGSYVARIKSVGRDGSSSPIKQIQFSIDGDVMLIEGAKNNATELGTLVQDNIKLYLNYSVYAWGSCVLDKYILDTNNSIVFKLWRAERANAAFGEASLVETITLYPATESGTDLDGTARAGLITRPSGTRSGSFETSQSVMFSPQAVDAADADKTVTYFLQAVNREIENDEVCLSLVLWSGADGPGSAIPGDPFLPEPPYIFPHFNSFHMQGAPNGVHQEDFPYDTRTWSANIENNYSLIGNRWTVAFWIRFDNLNAVDMALGESNPERPEGGDQIILTRGTIDTTGGGAWAPNAWRFWIRGVQGAGDDHYHQLHLDVYDKSGSPDRSAIYEALAYGTRSERSAIFRLGDALTGTGAWDHHAWYFIVICFEGGNYTDNDLPKVRLYMNAGIHEVTGEPTMVLMVPNTDTTTQSVEQDDTGSLMYQYEGVNDDAPYKYHLGVYTGDLGMGPWVSAGTQWHQLGIWNTALDSDRTGMGWNIGPIQTLYNEGRGWAVDWRRNTTQHGGLLNYRQAENLVHLNQFGAVEERFQTKRAGRDAGYHLPDWQGALNWTYDRWEQGYEFWRYTHGDPDNPGSGKDMYHQKKLPNALWYDNLGQSWSRGTDIYDVLSPGGTNYTTEYNRSYPGQGLSGDGSVVQDDSDLPSFGSWVTAGSDLFALPWISAPYAPGYHPEDPDRPIEGGT